MIREITMPNVYRNRKINYTFIAERLCMEQWANYFLATCGASAALTGLIFVAVSINLQRILSITNLPTRALGSLILLVNIMIISSLCLIPKQTIICLGIEILAIDGTVWCGLIYMNIQFYKSVPAEYKPHYFRHLFFMLISMLPFLVAGAGMCFSNNHYLFWLIPGITISIIKSLLDAWVLLVEINR
jgi:hypothetical protein